MEKVLLRKAIEDRHELIKATLALGLAQLHPLGHALLDVRLDDRQADPVESRLSRGELLENFDAQAWLLHHSPDAANLAFNPVQASDDGLLLGCIQHDGVYAVHELRVSPGVR
jgi:hypothetical protein